MNLAATHYNCTSPMDYISHHTLHSHIPIHHHTNHTAVTNHSFALIASPHLHLIHPLTYKQHTYTHPLRSLVFPWLTFPSIFHSLSFRLLPGLLTLSPDRLLPALLTPPAYWLSSLLPTLTHCSASVYVSALSTLPSIPLFDICLSDPLFLLKKLHVDPFASVQSLQKTSPHKDPATSPIKHILGMDTRILFALKQGPRSLENHIREFLACAHYSDLPDIILIEIFCDGINQPLRSQLRREGPRSSLSCFLDFALTVGLLFTVGVADEDTELTEFAPEAAPIQELTEFAPEAAPIQELTEFAPEAAPIQELTESSSPSSPLVPPSSPSPLVPPSSPSSLLVPPSSPSPLVPPSSSMPPLVPSSSTECPRESEPPERHRDSALPECPLEVVEFTKNFHGGSSPPLLTETPDPPWPMRSPDPSWLPEAPDLQWPLKLPASVPETKCALSASCVSVSSRSQSRLGISAPRWRAPALLWRSPVSSARPWWAPVSSARPWPPNHSFALIASPHLHLIHPLTYKQHTYTHPLRSLVFPWLTFPSVFHSLSFRLLPGLLTLSPDRLLPALLTPPAYWLSSLLPTLTHCSASVYVSALSTLPSIPLFDICLSDPLFLLKKLHVDPFASVQSLQIYNSVTCSKVTLYAIN